MERSQIAGPGRPNREEMDRRASLKRAQDRIKEIRGLGQELDEYRDRLHAPEPPDGWSYEWAAVAVLNKEDPHKIAELRRQGWTAVPLSRHPEMMPHDWSGETIVQDGLLLMERPAELTEEAKARQYREAVSAVRNKEEQLGMSPRGTFQRGGPNQKGVAKSYQPIAIPDGE
jgi:hypothetical protein